MTNREMRRIVEAHDGVWSGWWPALLALDPAQLEKLLVSSYPSIRSTVEHMVGSESWWQDRLEDKPEEDGPLHWARLDDIQQYWISLKQRRLSWIDGHSPETEVRFRSDSGAITRTNAWGCVIHIVSHAHFHRGQLAMEVRQMGHAPPSHHLIGGFMS